MTTEGEKAPNRILHVGSTTGDHTRIDYTTVLGRAWWRLRTGGTG
jgi:hypothetical protein